jgi:hypothetical protein
MCHGFEIYFLNDFSGLQGKAHVWGLDKVFGTAWLGDGRDARPPANACTGA